MRTQRNNQLLRELEGGNEHDALLFGQAHGGNQYQFDNTTMDMKSSVIVCKETEILGPDYCKKKPVFLPIHFPELRVPF